MLISVKKISVASECFVAKKNLFCAFLWQKKTVLILCKSVSGILPRDVNFIFGIGRTVSGIFCRLHNEVRRTPKPGKPLRASESLWLLICVNLCNPFSVAVSLLLRRTNLWLNFFYLFSVVSVLSVAEEFLVLGQKAGQSVPSLF